MPAPRLSSLQQERSRATRDRLVRAATELWREKGFDATTVIDICAAADVAKGTFYFYFPRKEDLLLEVGRGARERAAWIVDDAGDDLSTDALIHSIARGIATRTQRTSKALLAHTMIEMFRWMEHRPDGGPDREGLRATFRRALERGQARGEVRADLDLDDTAAAFTAAIHQAMLQWAQGWVGSRSLADVLHARVDLLLRGAAS